jgi:hypothetical protein
MKARLFIDKFNKDEDFPLKGLVSVTLKNKSQGYSWRIGIMDGADILQEGETTSYEVPSGFVFDDTSVLQLSPVEPDTKVSGDYAQLVVISMKVIDSLPLEINLRK